MYKVLAKILSNRLQAVIGNVASDSQSAFVKGKQILDGILVANEAVDETRRLNKDMLIFKVDFEKYVGICLLSEAVFFAAIALITKLALHGHTQRFLIVGIRFLLINKKNLLLESKTNHCNLSLIVSNTFCCWVCRQKNHT